METIKINVVVYEDGDLWIAQGIEYDIAAYADSLSQAVSKFERALIANLAMNVELGRPGLEKIGPAPQRFRELFEQAPFAISATSAKASPTTFGVELGDLRLADVTA